MNDVSRTISTGLRQNAKRLLLEMSAASRSSRLRTIRRFAEDEIVVPTGPAENRRFKVHRQPWTGPWFDAIDSKRWRRHFHTGGQQGGKTLTGSTIPLMWHLFEYGENVIYGIPDFDMVEDKWSDDIKPVIEASRYKELMPELGKGSKGGTPRRIRFANGATLTFMTAGGGDKKRAGKTARVMIITEADGFDNVGGNSREADKFEQLEGRLRAYGDQGILYAECTLSTEDGRTNREIKGGTNSSILLRCPHCRGWVTPERNHLIGWQNAADVMQAKEETRIACPACGEVWLEEHRRQANAECTLIHAGQEVKDGEIVGAPKRTDTLGFRWSAVNNLFVSQGDVGAEEWKAAKDPDEDRADKKMRQFFWAMPSKSSKNSLHAFNPERVMMRLGEWRRGIVPPETRCITLGIDVGLTSKCHWVAIAWLPGGTPHVLEYEIIDPASDNSTPERAIIGALREFRESVVRKGWQLGERTILPSCVLVDSGHWAETIYAFIAETGLPCYPAKGFSEKQASRQKDFSGQMYKPSLQPNGIQLVDINADDAKRYVHRRLQTPMGEPGAMTTFIPSPGSDHRTWAHHILAEREVEEFVAGKGTVTKFERIRRQNHYLDATALACVGGVIAGQRVVTPESQEAPAPVPQKDYYNPLTSYKNRW